MAVLGFDLDSTLVDLAIVSKVSKELGLSFKDTDHHDWKFSQFGPEFLACAKKHFSSVDFMCNLEPFPGTLDKLSLWKEMGHDLILVTARDRSIQGMTVEMVNRLFPDIFTYIDFVNPGESKRALMSKYQFDLWTDDAAHEIENSLDLGIKTYLISNPRTPYNHHVVDGSHPLLTIVPSVSSIRHL